MAADPKLFKLPSIKLQSELESENGREVRRWRLGYGHDVDDIPILAKIRMTVGARSRARRLKQSQAIKGALQVVNSLRGVLMRQLKEVEHQEMLHAAAQAPAGIRDDSEIYREIGDDILPGEQPDGDVENCDPIPE